MDTTLWLWIVIGAIGIVILWAIFNELKGIRMKVSELSAGLTELSTSLTEISNQLAKATQEIIDAVADAELPAEVTTKLEALKTMASDLKAAATKLDDLNPDQPQP